MRERKVNPERSLQALTKLSEKGRLFLGDPAIEKKKKKGKGILYAPHHHRYELC